MFEPGSLGLVRKRRKTGNERRPQAKWDSTERVCGVKFFFSLALIQVIELHWKEPF